MIYLRELIKVDPTTIPADHKLHLQQLHYKLNVLRAKWGKPMIVTSGYRTQEDHVRIYMDKGVGNPPMGSRHLIGAAADILDTSGDLKKWIGENLHVAEDLGLWMEAFEATGGIDGGWLHLQLYPPKSGNRFFYP